MPKKTKKPAERFIILNLWNGDTYPNASECTTDRDERGDIRAASLTQEESLNFIREQYEDDRSDFVLVPVSSLIRVDVGKSKLTWDTAKMYPGGVSGSKPEPEPLDDGGR